jgi:hypothetical protein
MNALEAREIVIGDNGVLRMVQRKLAVWGALESLLEIWRNWMALKRVAADMAPSRVVSKL